MTDMVYQNSKYPVVCGYHLGSDIAEGGFSRVFKAFNPSAPPPGLAAVKVIATKQTHLSHRIPDPAALKRIIKEIRVHETLKHQNILELYGSHHDSDGIPDQDIPPAVYICLAYAVGGDLFDQIVPDVGLTDQSGPDINTTLAHFFFVQLCSGLAFCHANGVCHRDLKPENLLLDGGGNLLISDFGLCAVFKYRGQERNLSDPCGSPPYAAPELALGCPYRAEPIDCWSAGIVLFTLLVGNTPWDEPTERSLEFKAYIDGVLIRHEPWTRIPRDALSLLRKLLQVDPNRRYGLADVLRHRWFQIPDGNPNPLLGADGRAISGARIAQMLAQIRCKAGELPPPDPEIPSIIEAAETTLSGGHVGSMPSTQLAQRYQQSFTENPTQPFSCTVALFTQNPLLASQRLAQPVASSFLSQSTLRVLVEALASALKKHDVHMSEHFISPHCENNGIKLSVSFIDHRKQHLVGSIRITKPDYVKSEVSQAFSPDTWLVVFKRTKGEVLSWKRMYEKVYQSLPKGMVWAR